MKYGQKVMAFLLLNQLPRKQNFFSTMRDVMSMLEAPKEKEEISKKVSGTFNKVPAIYRDFEFITIDQVSLFEVQQEL